MSHSLLAETTRSIDDDSHLTINEHSGHNRFRSTGGVNVSLVYQLFIARLTDIVSSRGGYGSYWHLLHSFVSALMVSDHGVLNCELLSFNSFSSPRRALN